MIQQLAHTVIERCALLATFSEEPDCLTRRSFTLALRQAHIQLADWMQAAGMSTREDSIGNLIGRYPAAQSGARTLLLGSHLDTVRDAGKYDGPLGVLVALACVEQLQQRGQRLPFAIEVIAFADEEGLRFHNSYLGSQAVAGRFDPHWLDVRDADGVSLGEAIRAFGGDPAALASAARQPTELLGYCEVHIEQGPQLEVLNLPVGVVRAIAGSQRVNIRFTGMAGHAGTVPMELRRDALCAAAEFVLAAETLARSEPDLVATVGQLELQPGASNVIPAEAWLSLDLRHPDDAHCAAAIAQLQARAEQIAAARNVALFWEPVQVSQSTLCDPVLRERLAQAVAEQGYPVHHLFSGAGHDAVALAALVPVAMLFVRCAGGISHHPAEAVASADVAVAIAVLGRFLELMASAL